MQFDDVVAAMGQSGIGSLDIVPLNLFSLGDPGVLPVETRLFNEAAEGTFGAFEAPVSRKKSRFLYAGLVGNIE